MTKSQARLLLLVLAAKRIAFRLTREGETFTVLFDNNRAFEVREALGVL
jgi:hypothetical protein